MSKNFHQVFSKEPQNYISLPGPKATGKTLRFHTWNDIAPLDISGLGRNI